MKYFTVRGTRNGNPFEEENITAKDADAASDRVEKIMHIKKDDVVIVTDVIATGGTESPEYQSPATGKFKPVVKPVKPLQEIIQKEKPAMQALQEKSAVQATVKPVKEKGVKPAKLKAEKPVKPVKVAKVPAQKEPTLMSPELMPKLHVPTTYPAWVKEALAVPFTTELSIKRFNYLSMYLLVQEIVPEYKSTTVDTIVAALQAWAVNHQDTVLGKELNNLSINRLRDIRARLEWVIVDVLYRYNDWAAAQPVVEIVPEPVTEPVQEIVPEIVHAAPKKRIRVVKKVKGATVPQADVVAPSNDVPASVN